MICPQCKTELNENVKFCTECGYDFTKITPSSLKKPNQDPLDGLNTIINTPENHTSQSRLGVKADRSLDSLKIGILFAGRYEILSEGKRGGMGVVFKVKDITLNKEKALKAIHPNLASEGDAILRFKQEVALSQDLVHPNIVRVYDYGDSDGIQYFTMEWIDGITLREIINKRKREKKPFGLEEAFGIISPLLNALAYAHRNMVHRDIKPENILVSREIDSGKLTVKLTDFGIAKMLSPEKFTSTSTQMGTPYYMAPEQKVDASHVDNRADIYSSGVVLFELLTLENTIGFKPPSEINKGLPKEVDDVLRKSVETKPEERFEEIEEFSEALRKILVKTIEKGGEKGEVKSEEMIEDRIKVKEGKADKVEGETVIERPIEGKEDKTLRMGIKSPIKWATFFVLLLAVLGVLYTYTLNKESTKPSKGSTIIASPPKQIAGNDQQSPKPNPVKNSKIKLEKQKETTKEKDKEIVKPSKEEEKKKEIVEIGKTIPDDEKRSAIVEANGYAEALQGKNIKDLREEALEDARRQALKVAETHTRSLTRGISVIFVNLADGRPKIVILEQKDFGIKDEKHYHVWIKAEVVYTIGKVSAEEKTLLGPQGPLTVKIWTDKKTYREGEEMKIYLQGNKQFYARVIYVDASGNIVQLLPNAYRSLSVFEGGITYSIPGQGDRFKLEIEPPFGLEKVTVLASSNPLGDVSMEQLDKGLYGYRGDIKTLGARSRGIKIKPTEPGQPSGGAAEFYEALWQVQTGK